MKDDRLYAKFTLDFPDHPKIKILSNEAFRCWFEAICWSRRHLTNGLLPFRFAVASWSLDVLRELCENDEQKPSLEQVENGFLIHDFLEHQTSREEIEAKREARKRAGHAGGIASGEARRKQNRSKREAKPNERRSKKNPETETETHNPTYESSNEDSPVGGRAAAMLRAARAQNGAAPSAPPPPCPNHPNGYEHGEPCQRCAALRRYHEANQPTATDISREWITTRNAASDAYDTALHAAVTACPKCDADGERLDGQGTCYEHRWPEKPDGYVPRAPR